MFKLTGTCTFNKAKVFKVIYMHVARAGGLHIVARHVIVITRTRCAGFVSLETRTWTFHKAIVSKMVVEIGENNDSVN